MSNMSQLRPKRMRLGTRSCAECRRRRVRCVFAPGDKSCQNCISHETECKPQQASGSNGDSGSAAGIALQTRIDALEQDLRRISGAHSDISSNTIMNPEEALNVLWPSRGTPAFEVMGPREAPVFQLLARTVNVVASDQTLDDEPKSWLDLSIVVQALGSLLPNECDLMAIFERTSPFWELWWTRPLFDLLGSRSQATAATHFVLDAMSSNNALRIACAVTWVALCLQQVSSKMNTLQTALRAPIALILGCYQRGASMLLMSAQAQQTSDKTVEYWMLYVKLCVNLGQLKQAWIGLRQAANVAILLRPDKNRDMPMKDRDWSYLWQLDRHLSLLQGFPPAVPDAYLGSVSTTAPTHLRLAHQIGLIAGHISERNFTDDENSYARTLEIEQELMKCSALMPTTWLSHLMPLNSESPDASAQSTHKNGHLKIFYYQLHKLLHLPYLLKGSKEGSQYKKDRVKCLYACRNIIKVYIELRNCRELSYLLCDLMDFVAFSAALVLVIDRLQSSAKYVAREGGGEEDDGDDDWILIQDLTSKLRSLSQVMECATAEQAAQLLEYLYLAGHGLYAGLKDYEGVVPFFGKVRIIGIKPVRQSSTSLPCHSTLPLSPRNPPTIGQYVDSDTGSVTTGSALVELSTNYFGQACLPGSDELELSTDWTTVFDGDVEYDWTYVFGGPKNTC